MHFAIRTAYYRIAELLDVGIYPFLRSIICVTNDICYLWFLTTYPTYACHIIPFLKASLSPSVQEARLFSILLMK